MQLQDVVCFLARSLVALATVAGAAGAQAVPNDNCSGAWPLALGQTPGTNEGSTTSPGGVSCSSIGRDVWYSLLTPQAGLLTVSTVASGAGAGGPADSGSTPPIDSVLALYGGSCGALQPLGCSDDVFPTLQSAVSVFVSAGQMVFVRVGGYLGDTGDFVMTVTLVDVPPVANDACANPLPLVDGVTTGSTAGATTSADPSSCGPPSNDVWFSYVASATGLLTISTVDRGEFTDFAAIITVYTGSCGALTEVACGFVALFQPDLGLAVTAGQNYLIRFGGFGGGSGNFVLALGLVPGEPAANDECSSAQLLTSDSVSGSTTLAFTGTGSGTCSSGGKNVWYAYAAPADGTLTASLLHNGGSADFDTVLAAYSGSCGSLQPVACNDDYDFDAGLYQSEASFPVTAGTLYSLSVGGFLGDSGDFTLSVKLQPDSGAHFVNPFNGHTYAFTPAPMTWLEARDFAASLGGHLATLDDPLEQVMVQAYLGANTTCWIGLTDEDDEGTFRWVTDEPLVFESWQPGQPDNNCGGGPENDVAMNLASGEWFDTNNTGCAGGLLRGLIEVDGTAPFASCTSVGQGCAPGAPPVLLGCAPVLGHTLTLTVLDPQTLSKGVILGSAIPVAPTDLGKCNLHIDPASRFVLAPVATDAIGFASIAIPVPSDTSLVGVSVALQVFLARDENHSAALSNGLQLVVGY